ncbi:type IV pilin-like G/H family protein [Lyngbya sp. CCY1209]|uniref:type IV pilin-like G/H family protein n=1 Tax=Lyngbya sp. CCY1209 TaxID=2886103 RepID=UPI002D2032AA|nr:type IV pilin-like G/H family protein [Lyngbya sp. CCY1209]MEB3883332.1 hypothetical protein [Lyngbya sp. CCY1209]
MKSWIERHPDRTYFLFFAMIFGITCLGLGLMLFNSFLKRLDVRDQTVAREVLTASLENQHRHLFSYGRFTPNLEALYKGTSEGKPGYRFEMNVDENRALINAVARRWRPSHFSGAIFVVSPESATRTVGGICRGPDKIVEPVQLSPSRRIQCPPDTVSIAAFAGAVFAVEDGETTQKVGGVCIVYHNPERRNFYPQPDAIAPPEPDSKKIRCPARSSLSKTFVIRH